MILEHSAQSPNSLLGLAASSTYSLWFFSTYSLLGEARLCAHAHLSALPSTDATTQVLLFNCRSYQTCVSCASPGQNLQAGLGHTQRDGRAGQVGGTAQIPSGK